MGCGVGGYSLEFLCLRDFYLVISCFLSYLVSSEAEVYLYGGCVTSWKAAGGKDLLFVRPDAVFTGKKPIR